MNLTRFLFMDIQSSTMKTSGTPGDKTPLVLKTEYDEELTDFLVSDSLGNLIHRDNAQGGVPSAFFPLPMDEEDLYQFLIADRIYHLGNLHEWGNVTEISNLDLDTLESILSFFTSYSIECEKIFCGDLGHSLLSGVVAFTSPEETEDFIKLIQQKYPE